MRQDIKSMMTVWSWNKFFDQFVPKIEIEIVLLLSLIQRRLETFPKLWIIYRLKWASSSGASIFSTQLRESFREH